MRLTAALWRAAETGVLIPTAGAREWLEHLRDDVSRYVGYDRKALRAIQNGESGVTFADEREDWLADHLGKLAACEGLLDRLPTQDEIGLLPLTGEHVIMGQIGEVLDELLHRVPLDDPYRSTLSGLAYATGRGDVA